jgi:hypothetical protein
MGVCAVQRRRFRREHSVQRLRTRLARPGHHLICRTICRKFLAHKSRHLQPCPIGSLVSQAKAFSASGNSPIRAARSLSEDVWLKPEPALFQACPWQRCRFSLLGICRLPEWECLAYACPCGVAGSQSPTLKQRPAASAGTCADVSAFIDHYSTKRRLNVQAPL